VKEAMIYYHVRDFRAIRIACQHDGCRAVIELSPSKIEEAMKKTNACCPLCGKPFTKPDVEGGADVITQLSKVVMALNKLGSAVWIEFPVVMEKSNEPAK
jgi:hypothetical protein